MSEHETIEIDGESFLIEWRMHDDDTADYFVTCPEWPSFWAVSETREGAIESATTNWRIGYKGNR